MSFESDEKVLFAIADVNEAKRLLEDMAGKNVELEIRHNDRTCRTGCKPAVEIWAKVEDIPKLQEYITEKNIRTIETEGVEVDQDQINSVYDPESKIAICPACGTEFSTDQSECPECGLVFMPK